MKKVGSRVHVDTDNKEWGRVASDGTIVMMYDRNALVNVDSIRAGILVPYSDMVEIGNPKAAKVAKEWPVGRRIVEVRPMTPEELKDVGWDWGGAYVPIVILDDGSILYPSTDPEGNGPGAIFFVTGKGDSGMLS